MAGRRRKGDSGSRRGKSASRLDIGLDDDDRVSPTGRGRSRGAQCAVAKVERRAPAWRRRIRPACSAASAGASCASAHGHLLVGGIGVAGIVGYYATKLAADGRMGSAAAAGDREHPCRKRRADHQPRREKRRGADPRRDAAPICRRRSSPSRTGASTGISASIRSASSGPPSPTGAAGGVVQGGSTLTQQLAKNLFLKPERTFERKIQEVILAVWLEAKLSKRRILELYLNRVYLGGGAYGVDAAALRYFGKSARNVTLAEAAMLAGLLKAPGALCADQQSGRGRGARRRRARRHA